MPDPETPGTPCPQCRSNMVLQYSKDDPHITPSLHTEHLQVPMRCCQCGINVVVRVDPQQVKDDDEDGGSWDPA